MCNPLFYIPPPEATDSNGLKIPASFTLNRLDELYYLSLKINTSECTYPVTVDPTTAFWREEDVADAAIFENDSKSNYGLRTTVGYLAGNWGAGVGKHRYVVRFEGINDSIPSNASIDSAKLSLYLSTSGTYDAHAYAALLDTPFTEGASSGVWEPGAVSWDSAKTGISWNGGSWRDFAYSDTIVNDRSGGRFYFRVDELVKKIVDKTYLNYGFIVIVTEESSEGYVWHGYHGESTTASRRPFLEIWGSWAESAPYNDTLLVITENKAVISVLDSNGYREFFTVEDSLGFVIDTIISPGTGDVDTLTDTLTVPLGNRKIGYKIVTHDSIGNPSAGELKFAWTLPDTPVLFIADTSDSSITITFLEDSNRNNPFYSLYDSSYDVYITPGGDTSGEYLQFKHSDWDTVVLSHIDVNEKIMLLSRVKNNDSVVSVPHSRLVWTWARIPEIDTAYVWVKDSLFIRINPMGNPSYTFYAIEDSITGYYFDRETRRLRGIATVDSSWAWATYSEWGGFSGTFLKVEPETRYVLRVFSKDGKQR